MFTNVVYNNSNGTDDMDSLMDPDFTYSFSKYSCVRGMFFVHIFFTYMIMLMGLGCFITRFYAKWLHPWFGRGYIIAMIWATATSLLIHNTGLPLGVLISFVYVLGGMCIGWLVINFHQVYIQQQASKNVMESLEKNGYKLAKGTSLQGMIDKEKGAIIARRTFKERFFSLKSLHGLLMVLSYVNIVGRIFATRLHNDYSCHTYPVYKPIDTHDFEGGTNSSELTLVPVQNPDYEKLPWAKTGELAWGILLFFGPLVGGAIFGIIYSACVSPKEKSSPKTIVEHESNSTANSINNNNINNTTVTQM